jgi:hypothetical protein
MKQTGSEMQAGSVMRAGIQPVAWCLDRVALNVGDIEAAQHFYCGALGFSAPAETLPDARPGWACLTARPAFVKPAFAA